MFVLEVIVAVAVLAAVALLAAGRFDGLADESPDDPDVGLPVGRPLRSSDVPRLRFRLAIRGYRMSDVDQAMAAVQETLRVAETQPQPHEVPEPLPAPTPPAPTPPAPTPPFEPEPTPPPPLPPLQPEPLPAPDPTVVETHVSPPAEVPTADQPPTEMEERPLSAMEVEVDESSDLDEHPSSPSPAVSWRMPPTPGA